MPASSACGRYGKIHASWSGGGGRLRDRPPTTKSCCSKVAGHVGGPHHRSSWRGSCHTCHTRSTLASNSATNVSVSAWSSLCELTTAMGLLPFSVFGQDLFNASGAVQPELLVGIEQAGRLPKRRHVSVHHLLPSASLFGNERSPFQDRHVLLHRCEAHREVLCESRYRLLVADHPGHDVATRGVRQGVEDAVGVRLAQLTYNHVVVG